MWTGAQPRRHAGAHRAARAALGTAGRSVRPQDHGRAVARQLRRRHGGDGVRDARLARACALRAVQGLFAGYGALTLAMAADRRRGTDGAGDRHRADGAAARAGAGPGDRRRASPRSSACARLLRDRAASTRSRSWSCCIVLRRTSRARIDAAKTPRSAEHVTFANVLAFENFLLLMARDLRVPVRRSQLRAGAAALRRRGRHQSARVAFCRASCSRYWRAAARSGTTSAPGCCARIRVAVVVAGGAAFAGAGSALLGSTGTSR